MNLYTIKLSKNYFDLKLISRYALKELNRDTIVGLANTEKSFTVKIPARVKRRVFEEYRREGKPKQFGPQMFVAALLFALQKSDYKIQELVIDTEYPGYERDMFIKLNKFYPHISVYFTQIGKKSAAHFAVYGVYIKKREPDVDTHINQIMRILKNGSRTVTPPDKAERFAVHAEPSKSKYRKK